MLVQKTVHSKELTFNQDLSLEVSIFFSFFVGYTSSKCAKVLKKINISDFDIIIGSIFRIHHFQILPESQGYLTVYLFPFFSVLMISLYTKFLLYKTSLSWFYRILYQT
jgi:hypothetical protein